MLEALTAHHRFQSIPLSNFGLDKLLRLVVGEMDDLIAGVFDQILEGNHASVDTQFVQ